MAAPYRSRMGRDALENGPDEPHLAPCWRCGGGGWLPNAVTDGTCAICQGDGEIQVDRDEVEE